MKITSLQNPKVKALLHLRERRARDETGLFLIEGYRELLRFLDHGGKAEEIFFCPELFLGSNEQALIARIKGEHYECSPQVFQKISYRDRPDGLLAVAPQKRQGLKELTALIKTKKAPFLVVAEAIEKPGNLGTILRSTDASGADALIVCDKCTDLFNPNVVRASVGTLFSVPVFEASSSEMIAWLKQQGIQIIAATPHASKLFTEVDLTQAIAIAMGTEQLGLSETWMKQSDMQVRIPMKGAADSLNVAMATTLLLYEVVRQRQSC